MHVVCVFTDDTNVLIVKQNNQIIFPNTVQHWPLEWKRRTCKSTAEKLLRFISFGVLEGSEGTSQTFYKLFGLHENTAVVQTKVSSEVYTNLVNILHRVMYHAFHRAKCDFVHVDSIAIQDLLNSKSASVETLHCIRALYDSQLNK